MGSCCRISESPPPVVWAMAAFTILLLVGALTQVRWAGRKPASRTVQAESDRKRLLDTYAHRGRFAATVQPKIIRLPENRVDVVYAIKEICDADQVPHPNIVSESGRAIAAHHSVLVVNVLGVTEFNTHIPQQLERPAPPIDDPPRVTILIPAKDEGQRIGACLQSALAQINKLTAVVEKTRLLRIVE